MRGILTKGTFIQKNSHILMNGATQVNFKNLWTFRDVQAITTFIENHAFKILALMSTLTQGIPIECSVLLH